MATPTGKRAKRLFVDEMHEIYMSHPQRVNVWKSVVEAISQLNLQIMYLSATHPPHLHGALLKNGSISSPIRVLRASTNRPELGYFVFPFDVTGGKPSLRRRAISLVAALKKTLREGDRILVFFSSTSDADAFAWDTKCAVYHSQLGNGQMNFNLDQWDTGEQVVMAASPAAALGVDRRQVRYVLDVEPQYGLALAVQEFGRGGRDGQPAYCITLYNNHIHYITPNRKLDLDCLQSLQDYKFNMTVCRRKFLLEVMDGKALATTCLKTPGSNLCDVCNPDGEVFQLMKAALDEEPKKPAGGYPGHHGPVGALCAPLNIAQTRAPGLAHAPTSSTAIPMKASAVPPAKPPAAVTPHAHGHGSEDDFDGFSLTSSMERAMDQVTHDYFEKVSPFLSSSH